MILSLGAAGLLVWLVFAYARLVSGLPALESFPLLFDPPQGRLLQPTRLYDRTGQHVIQTLLSPAASKRQAIRIAGQPAEQQPQALIKATLASLDESFWQNPGFTIQGLLEGTHPTMAQKLVSDFMLNTESPGLRRNIRERLLAGQITQSFGREKILEWYLNTAQYGPFIYGADAAGLAFFSKHANELSLAEAALLAAAAESPGIYPSDISQVIALRQQAILRAIFIQGWITSDELQVASKESVSIQPAVPLENLAPAFTHFMISQLGEVLSSDEIARGGYRIITTLDFDLQIQANCAADFWLARLSGNQVSAGIDPCKAARLLPTMATIQEDLKAGALATAQITLDPATGQVLSMVGVDLPGLNPASLPGHPPGTLITPMVYLTAFTRGFSPASLFWDIPSPEQPGLAGAQETRADFHGPLRLRTALVNDYPGPARQLFNQLGQENMMKTARELGITSLDLIQEPATNPDVFTSYTNQRQITLLEAVQAYGVFANQGMIAGRSISATGTGSEASIRPITILRVETSSGQTVLDWSITQSRPVLSQQLAYLMTQVLSDEAARWPSLGHPNPLEIGRPAAAKIGSTLAHNDEWTVGYTPQLVIGTWVGSIGEPSATIPKGASAALWHALTQYAMSSLPARGWEIPPGVSVIEVCDPSGLLPSPDCPVTVPEVFLNGFEPTQVDNLYHKFEINRDTEKLATVFTPPGLIEERVYLVTPPQASEWAEKAGLPLPPKDWDTIYAPEERYPDTRIDQPQIFTHVRDQVVFQGSAAGENFKFYRLQVGQGLNPQQWLQIGPDYDKPVNEGTLGTWDTHGLSGLYTIQLLVVRKDQSIERVISQVTVDNIPPEVSIIKPDGNTILSLSKTPNVLIEVEANDNLELSRVEFYLDERLVVSLVKPPFAYPWKPRQGTHLLRVIAIDLAGNKSEATQELKVEK